LRISLYQRCFPLSIVFCKKIKNIPVFLQISHLRYVFYINFFSEFSGKIYHWSRTTTFLFQKQITISHICAIFRFLIGPATRPYFSHCAQNRSTLIPFSAAKRSPNISAPLQPPDIKTTLHFSFIFLIHSQMKAFASS